MDSVKRKNRVSSVVDEYLKKCLDEEIITYLNSVLISPKITIMDKKDITIFNIPTKVNTGYKLVWFLLKRFVLGKKVDVSIKYHGANRE